MASHSVKKNVQSLLYVIGTIGFGLVWIHYGTIHIVYSDKNQEFVEVFDKKAVAFAVRVRSPKWIWELKRYLNIGWEKELKDDVQVLNKAMGDLIMPSTKEKMNQWLKARN